MRMAVLTQQPTLGESESLGPPREAFGVATGTLVVQLLILLGGAAAGAGLLLRYAPQVAAGQTDMIVPAAIGVLILGVVAYTAYAHALPIWRNRSLHVEVHEHGFACVRDGRTSSCRWDDVARVWQVIRRFGRGYHRRIEVNSRQGDRWVFDNRIDMLDRFWELTDRIEREVARCMQPRALAEIRGGRPWHFGAVEVAREGLTYAGQFLAWGQLRKTTCNGLSISLYTQEGWRPSCQLGTHEVPNLRLLLNLIRELSPEQPPAGQGC
jgi:hypothetical protein